MSANTAAVRHDGETLTITITRAAAERLAVLNIRAWTPTAPRDAPLLAAALIRVDNDGDAMLTQVGMAVLRLWAELLPTTPPPPPPTGDPMSHLHDRSQIAALAAARTATPIPPAHLLHRPAADPRHRWELHLPDGRVYPRATFADTFATLAALGAGLNLTMSPTGTAAAVAELANVTRLAHIDEEPPRWLIVTPARPDAYTLDEEQALLHAAQRGAPITMSPETALELWRALTISEPTP